jgi:hypothetical protein
MHMLHAAVSGVQMPAANPAVVCNGHLNEATLL